MIVRIVKMTFEPSKVPEFLANFEKNKNNIRNFKGCHKLRLLKGLNDENVYFTYSWWDNEEALNQYRISNLFKGVWSKTKTLFIEKPEAWSLVNAVEL